jgi:hypothetical protein
MADIVNLDSRRRPVAFKYRHGDICQSLRLALSDEHIANDIEDVLEALLFDRADESADGVREVLFELLEAAQ